MARQQTLLLAIRDQIGAATILHAPALASAATGFIWTDLPRTSLPNLVNLFGRAANASVRQLRVVPSTYPAWLTPAEITRIQRDIASLLGVPAATPSPSPSPTLSPSPGPSASPTSTGSPSPTPSGSVPAASPSPT